jgi:hypothetical protein
LEVPSIFKKICCCNELLWLTHHKRALELWRLHHCESIHSKHTNIELSIFTRLYTFQEDKIKQNIWDKVRCYGEPKKQLFPTLSASNFQWVLVHFCPSSNQPSKRVENCDTLNKRDRMKGNFSKGALFIEKH